MTSHRYTLEPYHGRASRFMCPSCRHGHRTFKRYIDTETNTYLADHVGKCDRIDQCGYHCPPRIYFANGGSVGYTNAEPRTSPPFNTMPKHLVNDMAKAYERNNFITFLTRCCDEATALRLAERYKIGTSKHWPGATIFWQIDIKDNVRTGKIMLYNPTDGHRVKKPFNHITWAHTLQGRGSGSEGRVKQVRVACGGGRETIPTNHEPGASNPKPEPRTPPHEPKYNLQQCFFGEHLLATHPFKTVAIAEAEKTAVICNFIYPEYIWLAAGSLDGLSLDKCRVLKERQVILYPDLNGYQKWKQKAHELNRRIYRINVTVDDSLERTATDEERARGLDMADRWIDQILK